MGLFKRSKPTPDLTAAGSSSTSTSGNTGTNQDTNASTSNLSTTTTLVAREQDSPQPSRNLKSIPARLIGKDYLKKKDPEYDAKLNALLERIEKNYVPKPIPPRPLPSKNRHWEQDPLYLLFGPPRAQAAMEERYERRQRVYDYHQQRETWAMNDLRDMSLSQWRAKHDC
ncbi:hypothetical protein GLAREA_00277 [Glarea lozoyensis ATCC 20868]|uniref:Uncharacterized protein n=1 Tax=Glarea lozoyensis (strain ATCC 20868 / MF5171) TaxID=1116229 RepID=S3CW02_GLAL2|nr:uncharacterized protein GLAREA_00277 [Glarea lozoyensis ATCC 20868]EPE29119.1 hypothetical protein GLAREA_00277 [Glarea lozoyensis ATCC 20868]